MDSYYVLNKLGATGLASLMTDIASTYGVAREQVGFYGLLYDQPADAVSVNVIDCNGRRSRIYVGTYREVYKAYIEPYLTAA